MFAKNCCVICDLCEIFFLLFSFFFLSSMLWDDWELRQAVRKYNSVFYSKETRSIGLLALRLGSAGMQLAGLNSCKVKVIGNWHTKLLWISPHEHYSMSEGVKAAIENRGESVALLVVLTKPCSTSRYCAIMGLLLRSNHIFYSTKHRTMKTLSLYEVYNTQIFTWKLFTMMLLTPYIKVSMSKTTSTLLMLSDWQLHDQRKQEEQDFRQSKVSWMAPTP